MFINILEGLIPTVDVAASGLCDLATAQFSRSGNVNDGAIKFILQETYENSVQAVGTCHLQRLFTHDGRLRRR